MGGRSITDREAYPAAWITLAVLAAAFLLWRFALGEPTASQTFVLSEAKALAGSRVSATTSAEEITLFMETDHTSSIHKLPIL